KLIAGAMMVLRTQHDPQTVLALEHLLREDHRAVVHHEAIPTLARLYQIEATWDGSWWNTRPDTRGPHFKSARWDGSSAIAQMMLNLAEDSDQATAKDALAMIGLCGMGEAVPMLTRIVSTDNPLRKDAANALIQMKSPDAVAAMEKIAAPSSGMTPTSSHSTRCSPPPRACRPIRSSRINQRSRRCSRPSRMTCVTTR